MATVEDDEESQRAGAVALLYLFGNHVSTSFDHELHSRVPQALEDMPVRICGLHMCSDSMVLKLLRPLFVATMGRSLRVRLRVHAGKSMSV